MENNLIYFWPFTQLLIHTPRLKLKLADNGELLQLAALAHQGIHDPEEMPFEIPWSKASSPELERSVVQHHWESWGNLRSEKWRLPFVVLHNDNVIGTQTLSAENFSQNKIVGTGSWLGQKYQSKGFGKEMRAAVLFLAFKELDAKEARTSVFEYNQASKGVTKSLGYTHTGSENVLLEKKEVVKESFSLSKEIWAQKVANKYKILVEGIDGCLPLLGA